MLRLGFHYLRYFSMTIMKNISKKTLAAAIVSAVSLVSVSGAYAAGTKKHAPDPVRQQNKAELNTLEKNGYQPSANNPNYPTDIQNAQRRAAGNAGATGNTGTGATSPGSTTTNMAPAPAGSTAR